MLKRLAAPAAIVGFFALYGFVVFQIGVASHYAKPSQQFLTMISVVSTTLTAKDIIAFIGTIFATFVGAWFAFKFARIRREKERIDNETAAGNRALFTLCKMWGEIRQYQEVFIDPYRERSDAWFNMLITQPLYRQHSFDIKELSFVIPVDAYVFQRVFLEEQNFRLAAFIIDEHRDLNFKVVLPRLESGGMHFSDSRSVQETEKIVGITTAKRMKDLTAAIIKNFDDRENSLREAFVLLRATLKKVHSNRKFIAFDFEGRVSVTNLG